MGGEIYELMYVSLESWETLGLILGHSSVALKCLVYLRGMYVKTKRGLGWQAGSGSEESISS